MKSTVVDESLSSYKPMYCSREYQTSTRLNQQYEKSTLNDINYDFAPLYYIWFLCLLANLFCLYMDVWSQSQVSHVCPATLTAFQNLSLGCVTSYITVLSNIQYIFPSINPVTLLGWVLSSYLSWWYICLIHMVEHPVMFKWVCTYKYVL